MDIQYWLTIKTIFVVMCYIGIATNIGNVMVKTYVEKRPLRRWIGGTIISCIAGFVLYSISFGIFGMLEPNPIKKGLFFDFVLIIGLLMPLWFDPILTLKFYFDKKRYVGEPGQMRSMFSLLILLSIVFLSLLIFDKMSA